MTQTFETASRIPFDTSAFMPAPGRRAHQQGSWQRFTLVMTRAEEEKEFARLQAIEEDCSRTGRWAAHRAACRRLVNKYAR